jgi:hypothetical protein
MFRHQRIDVDEAGDPVACVLATPVTIIPA